MTVTRKGPLAMRSIVHFAQERTAMIGSGHQRSRAFTLPELLVVIAVIAILAAILLSNLWHVRAQAATAACEANERSLAAAIEEFATDHNGAYPTTVGAITLQTFGGPGNPYIDPSNLTDPASGLPYSYVLGQGSCVSSVATFEIHDLGGHDGVSINRLPQNAQNTDSIAYCAGVGLVADDSHQAAEMGVK
jgi:prepilin-type N-terminal cleavage/methylation domain-containing protein